MSVVGIRLRADPDRHVTVTIIDVIEEDLIDHDRAGELKHHVIVVTTHVVDGVSIICARAFGSTGYAQALCVGAEVRRSPCTVAILAAEAADVNVNHTLGKVADVSGRSIEGGVAFKEEGARHA